ncbi:protein aurora borealis [Chelonus insularis]|uniref:protein aurora borealis n=1 Tax=Chelonus insularis TaxID=460826 RepID=UPI00158BABAF|nr:protein aurora borealis [Chelonus insularis]
MEEIVLTPVKKSTKREKASVGALIHRTPLKQQNGSKLFQENKESLAILSNHFTPPSRVTKFIASNPFDVELTNRLHLSVISPTIFKKVSPKAQDSPLTWTIDELARLQPVKIEECPVQQVHYTDPELESKAQEAINKFFYENQIHPSPWNNKREPLKPLITITPKNLSSVLDTTPEIEKKTKNCWTQTTLSFPPNLPDHVKEILEPYFNFNQDQQQQTDDSADESSSSNSSFRRKLFNHDESVDDDSNCSLILSPIKSNVSPLRCGMLVHCTPQKRFPLNMQRSYDTPIKKSDRLLSTPNMSPINMSSENMSCHSIQSRGRLAMQLDFNGHMSIDMSISEEKESDFKIADASDNENEIIDEIKNENSFNNKNETVEMISLSREVMPLQDCTNKNNSVATKLKNTGDWYMSYSNESYKLQRNITSAGHNENSSVFAVTQDTGYQTYSIHNNTSNIHNRSTTPLKKAHYHHDFDNGMTPISEIKLSDWQKNIESMFSSTPSKSVQKRANFL